MIRFEYKTVSVPTKKISRWGTMKIDQETLNGTLKGLGEQGWELVSTIDNSIGGSMIEIVMIFKRAV